MATGSSVSAAHKCSVPPISTTIAVLGKRKRTQTSSGLILHLSGGSCSSSSETEYQCSDENCPDVQSETGSEIGTKIKHEIDASSISHQKRAATAPVIINGKLVTNPDCVKKFACTFEGCTKSYKKPSRLKEHERSHTGERPFICTHEGCTRSYLRESHLHAHARSHLSPLEKPFVCTLDGCGKRYWTAQHLRRHEEVHNGEKPFHCSHEGCLAKFSKNKQLRGHVAAEHGVQGMKNFKCDHDGCTKAFATNQKLTAHLKVHDERRYTCCQPVCLQNTGNNRPHFRTWSDLQAHNRLAHPATCPYLSCNGRTFNSHKNLRGHLKVHEEREADEELRSDSDADDEGERNLDLKRRRDGKSGRDWKCDVKGCGKDFKSKNTLKTHVNVAHLNQRNFVCTHPGCNAAYGYKHLLRRHSAKAHKHNDIQADEDAGAQTVVELEQPYLLTIDGITGKRYKDRATAKLDTSTKTLQCPFPRLPVVFTRSDSEVPTSSSNIPIQPHSDVCQCVYVFSRAYDLHRHLRAMHGLDTHRHVVDAWVRKMKSWVDRSTIRTGCPAHVM